MDKSITEAIFLITGIITAAGANRDHPLLLKAKSQLLDEQYDAALFTAERIIKYYPDTEYAKAAQVLIDIIQKERRSPSSLVIEDHRKN